MGTDVLVLAPRDRAAEAAEAVEGLFAYWESTLSRFQPESELCRLGARAGTPVRVSGLLLGVLVAALDAARATSGRFDPTLGGELGRIGYSASFETLGAVPRVSAPPRGGGAWRDIVVDAARSTVTLPPGCSLDLGAIAKGMAVDAALELLGSAGIEPALVSAGGDLAVRGLPQSERSWPILVEGAGDVVRVTRGALATSGTARRRWLQGEIPRHHLVDPRTGEPASHGLLQVTVAAGSCRVAEVAATAAFVGGPRAGVRLLERNRLAGLLLTENGGRVHAGPWPRGSHAGAV
jgi:thiamine biosynthesis lipoprotein